MHFIRVIVENSVEFRECDNSIRTSSNLEDETISRSEVQPQVREDCEAWRTACEVVHTVSVYCPYGGIVYVVAGQ